MEKPKINRATVNILHEEGGEPLEWQFDNLTVDEYRMVGERPGPIPTITERYPVGEPIVLMTSNMPHNLKSAINDIIKKYCNH